MPMENCTHGQSKFSGEVVQKLLRGVIYRVMICIELS